MEITSDAAVIAIRMRFQPEAPVRLQPYAGSAWRGAFGHALRKTVCVTRLPSCGDCPLRHVCVHPRFFPDSSVPVGEEPARYAAPPPPFVLSPDPTPRDGVLGPEQSLTVRLRIFGPATEVAPYALHALKQAGLGGIGAGRVPLQPTAIARESEPEQPLTQEAEVSALTPRRLEIPPPPSSATLRLVTPLRLRLQGDLLTGRTLQPRHLVAAGLGRAGLLGMITIAAEERREVLTLADRLTWQATRLGWLETVRVSSRQGGAMRFGGIVGSARLDLAEAATVWPSLWLASVMHLGKGASMGFGRIDVDAA